MQYTDYANIISMEPSLSLGMTRTLSRLACWLGGSDSCSGLARDHAAGKQELGRRFQRPMVRDTPLSHIIRTLSQPVLVLS